MKEKFEKKINKTTDDKCWLWLGSIGNHSYGRLWFNGKRYLAHRLSWIIYKGEIPKNKCVCHKCDNPLCVNPEHLFIGTHDENMKDMSKKGRVRFVSILDESSVRDIKMKYRAGGNTYGDLAKAYKVSKICIEKILLGKRWKKVTI